MDTQPDGLGRSPPGPDAATDSPPRTPPEPARAEGAVGYGEAVGTRTPQGYYELGVLNRHWYRRCLDALGKTLRAAGSDPSIEKLQKLGDQIITAFLTSVTGQAPDSNQPQFPADRAYYIPFEGDNAAKFNFAKPYYQLLSQPAGRLQDLEDSLWSFWPWVKGGGAATGIDLGREREEVCFISRKASVNEKQQTISFAEMISVRYPDDVAEVLEGEDRDVVWLKKSLLLRGDEDYQIRELFSAATSDSTTQPDDKGLRAQELSAQGLRERFNAQLGAAVVEIFEIYRAAPGNAAIELLLQNHLQVIRWLAQLGDLTGTKATDGVVLSQRDEGYKALVPILLRGYFLDSRDFEPSGSPTSELKKRQEQLLNRLRVWLSSREEERAMQTRTPLELARDLLEMKQAPSGKSWFERDLERGIEEHAGAMGTSTAQAREKGGEIPNEKRFEEGLNQITPHFRSFFKYFLKAGAESRLERDLAASRGDDPRRAGESRESFVWVTPDFADLAESLPEDPLRSKITEVLQKRLETINKQLETINRPYQTFFRELELKCLEGHRSAISNYWRTRGQANRKDWIYASFDDPASVDDPTGDRLMVVPRNAMKWPADPRPQNMFLRVKICDSLNEPYINGLFVFTADHDEVEFKRKEPRVRREDVEDLLSFAKVFFFAVRDHLHGLDRARDASDIGRLNQHLYDRRLSILEQRMSELMKLADFRDITHPQSWSRFIYNIINNYAHSLIDKPKDVRIETFPYDRLLIIPLTDWSGGGFEYELPFYLFQALFYEREERKVNGEHFSLLKPFQSPVETVDASSPNRFEVRTFQQVFEEEKGQRRLRRFLEKCYVSESGSSDSLADPDSYVPRLVPLDMAENKTDRGKKSTDRGRDWSKSALIGFWDGTKGDVGLWKRFLGDLTQDYSDLRADGVATEDARKRQLWFWFRFGILRSLLGHVKPNDPDLIKIQDVYANKELKLRFDDRDDLNVLKMAMRQGADPFHVLDHRSRRDAARDSPLGETSFCDYFLSDKDPFVLAFLKHLTLLVKNDSLGTDSNGKSACTWYQPLLTRAVEMLDQGKPGDINLLTAKKIEGRIPIYQKIAEGRDAIAMFLGVVELSIAQTALESRQLRCVIAMIRDYDDAKVGRVQSPEEAKEQLEIDRSDLTLYTRTFFQNVQRFLRTARERQQVRVLSTDITQIARNWYSSGITLIIDRLQKCLQKELTEGTSEGLGRLRSELMKCLFEVMVRDVLLRQEKDRNGVSIKLESFPFDRVMHIPLNFGVIEATHLSYARTTVKGVNPTEPPDPGGRSCADPAYSKIRSGRHAALGNGEKVLAADSPFHFAPSERLTEKPYPDSDSLSVLPGNTLRETLEYLERDSRLGDALVRRLYTANPIQSLAVAGLVFHLVAWSSDAGDGSQTRSNSGLSGLGKRLRVVLGESIRSLERDRGDLTVIACVHMDREASLEAPRVSPSDASYVEQLVATLGRVDYLPLYYEFFMAAERTGYRYGLGPGVKSKVFYVYYSIPAPEGFMEDLAFDGWYRGMFCFIVDDATTDAKAGESRFSDAEVADQEDIRTFIHNTMTGLKLVLDQQALEYEIRQPGVEQFIHGMLHRLKNELNEPANVLHLVKEAFKTPTAITQEAPQLQIRIANAESTITGIGKMFDKLKGFSDDQRGFILIQKFSTDWIGWLFVTKLCEAAIKEVAKSEPRQGDPRGPTTIRGKLEEIRRNGEGLLEGRGMTDSIPRIERALQKLEGLLVEYLGGKGDPGLAVEFLLSFEVFATEPLLVRGSRHLKEAFTILIENAFQACWSFVQKKLSETSCARPIVARLSLICRPSDLREGEILVEIRNSSARINPEWLEILNAKTPQPNPSHRCAMTRARRRAVPASGTITPVGSSRSSVVAVPNVVGSTCGSMIAIMRPRLCA